MKIELLISNEVKEKLNYKVNPAKKRRQKRHKEKLSRRDIEDLMGIDRDVYVRKGGAMRRK